MITDMICLFWREAVFAFLSLTRFALDLGFYTALSLRQLCGSSLADKRSRLSASEFLSCSGLISSGRNIHPSQSIWALSAVLVASTALPKPT